MSCGKRHKIIVFCNFLYNIDNLSFLLYNENVKQKYNLREGGFFHDDQEEVGAGYRMTDTLFNYIVNESNASIGRWP